MPDPYPTYPEEIVAGSGPVGDGSHTVQDGECASSLAAMAGLQTEDIWEHPDNAELKALRKDPNVLLPHDKITIPPVDLKEFDRATDQKHPFQLKEEPVMLRMKILDRDQPVAGKPFKLKVGSLLLEGVTGADGGIETEIPPTEIMGTLIVDTGADQLHMILKLGALHPVESPTGVQQRLQNLGFDCGPIDGIVGPRTRAAIKAFQKANQMEDTGRLDPDTRNRLKDKYGC